MSILANFARGALSFIKAQASQIAGAPEAAEAVQSLRNLASSVTGFADPPTRAELDALERDVFAKLDATIDKLGDD